MQTHEPRRGATTPLSPPGSNALPRRTALAALAASPLALLFACKRETSKQATPAPTAAVVLYCSADSVYARPILDAFTKHTGINVLTVFDTEATKTTGLVQRLLAEKNQPKADVWWSSEPFGTIKLARAEVLAPYTSAAAEEAMKPHGGWPSALRAKDQTWYGFGCRARVFVYNTKFVEPADAPQTLAGMLNPEFKGRIGMARPQFGTTRGHMAAICATLGREAFAAWLTGLRENGLRLFDGNGSVTRAVGNGDLWVALTDSDDVYAGKREGWPIELRFERSYPRPGRGEIGPMLIPNTAALVKGSPNAAAGGRAAKLIEYLLSHDAQRALAESDSHNLPVDPTLAAEFEKYAVPSPAELDLERVADTIDEAMTVCELTLKGL